jgi:hypothetical protein
MGGKQPLQCQIVSRGTAPLFTWIYPFQHSVLRLSLKINRPGSWQPEVSIYTDGDLIVDELIPFATNITRRPEEMRTPSDGPDDNSRWFSNPFWFDSDEIGLPRRFLWSKF